MKYQHQKIEKKWQQIWEQNQTFRAVIDPKKPKYYVLDMFPYPSGAGLHVGHVEGYTATDILARYKRKQGFNVLHPMGWDSFGLSAEQYAVRTGTHPTITTKTNTDRFRKQLKSLGFSYDWNREYATSDPQHYKWTQWIFTILYEKGLAYEAEIEVNYCPALGTVLANEEVENGRSKEGGFPVERRPLKQWVLKITEYAERLIDDLDLVDWPEGLKRLQRNWIGKSKGAYVDFHEKKTASPIRIFTTCPHTLFGATYMVLAPEHPLVPQITSESQKSAVLQYQMEAKRKSDLVRTELTQEKTGVFTGAYAINPVNEQEIPIWISDYVLLSYGTGAIMAVPAHDSRDFAFAKTYELPILPVIDPIEEEDVLRQDVLSSNCCWPGEGILVHSHHKNLSIDGMPVAKAIETVIRWLENNDKGFASVQYRLRDWLFSRQRYWGEPFPLLKFTDGTVRILSVDELPLCPPDLTDFRPTGDGQSPLAKVHDWIHVTDPKTGKPAMRESNTMPQWAGSCWYYLRFCDPTNQEQAWGKEAEQYWLPVDMYIGGVEHAVLHLLYARFWHKVLYDCGYVHTLEPFQTLRNPGLVVARSYQDANGLYVPAEDVTQKDGEYYHATTGEKLRSQIEKMSKSKLNGVTPDEIIEEFGADSLRLYEMFMGPLEKEKIWNTDAVSGCFRFLSRIYDLLHSDKLTEEHSEKALQLGHRLIEGVLKDIEQLQFNTAIAKMMEFLNEFSRFPSYPKSVVQMLAHVLSPFAPHLAEEMWEHLQGNGDINFLPFPPVDPKYLEEESITYVVQVNGKLRGRFELPKDVSQEEILSLAKKHPSIHRFLDGKEIQKVVFVPNKLLNLVLAT